MTYRKKRIIPAPNKNNAKVQRREFLTQSEMNLRAFDPRVERISIRLNFYDARGNPLDQRQLSFEAGDNISLQVDCQGTCGNGKIDLEGKVRDMIAKQLTISEGRAKCAQTLYAGSSDTCGYEVIATTEIEYKVS